MGFVNVCRRLTVDQLLTHAGEREESDCLQVTNRSRTEKLSYNDYKAVLKENKKLYSPHYIVYYKRHRFNIIKTAVKKKVSKKAVDRNYTKRIMRAILSQCIFRDDFLVLIINIKPIKRNSFQRQKKYLLQLCEPILSSSYC